MGCSGLGCGGFDAHFSVQTCYLLSKSSLVGNLDFMNVFECQCNTTQIN